MKENTKTIKRESKKATKSVAMDVKVDGTIDGTAVVAMENSDIRNAVLTTSLLINLFFLTAWVAVQVSTDYAQAIGAAIFNM